MPDPTIRLHCLLSVLCDRLAARGALDAGQRAAVERVDAALEGAIRSLPVGCAQCCDTGRVDGVICGCDAGARVLIRVGVQCREGGR